MRPELSRHLVDTSIGIMHAVMRTQPSRSARPLVMLHMSPRSSRMYLRYMDTASRTVIAVDRAGFGASDVPHHPPTMTDYASATLEALDALGIHDFDVVGTHTGSVEAVELAHLAPHRVGALILVSLPAYAADEVEERLRGVAAPRSRPDRHGDHLLAMWRRRAALRTPPLDLDHLHELFVDELVSMAEVHWAYRAVLDYPLLDRLDVASPLIVLAPHDDLWSLTARAREALPEGARFVELPDLDFDLWERAPRRMDEIVERELEAVAASKRKGVEGTTGDC